jgi:hypothetical protein
MGSRCPAITSPTNADTAPRTIGHVVARDRIVAHVDAAVCCLTRRRFDFRGSTVVATEPSFLVALREAFRRPEPGTASPTQPDPVRDADHQCWSSATPLKIRYSPSRPNTAIMIFRWRRQSHSLALSR